MRTIAIEHNLGWVPRPNEARPILATRMPPRELITSALALAFADDHLLLAELTHRGWDIPGGHIEAGECPEDATRREVHEETGALLGPAKVIAHQRIRILAPPPAEYRYPYPESYQVFYAARVASLEPFTGTAECRGRALFAPSDARNLPWVRQFGALYEAALVGSASLPRA